MAEDGTVTSGGLVLVEGEYTLEMVVFEEAGADAHVTAMLPGGGFVVLDTQVTLDLALEGTARDLIRAVQQARRDADLDVSDRIALVLTGSQVVADAVRDHEALITGETLATSYAMVVADGVTGTPVGDGDQVTISVTTS